MPENKLDWGDAIAMIFYILGILSIVGGIALSAVWAELTQFIEASGWIVNTLNFDTTVAMFFMLAIGIIYLVVGWLLQERYKAGKVLAFVFGVLFLFAFPIGTVLGLLILYTILGSSVRNEYTKEI